MWVIWSYLDEHWVAEIPRIIILAPLGQIACCTFKNPSCYLNTSNRIILTIQGNFILLLFDFTEVPKPELIISILEIYKSKSEQKFSSSSLYILRVNSFKRKLEILCLNSFLNVSKLVDLFDLHWISKFERVFLITEKKLGCFWSWGTHGRNKPFFHGWLPLLLLNSLWEDDH